VCFVGHHKLTLFTDNLAHCPPECIYRACFLAISCCLKLHFDAICGDLAPCPPECMHFYVVFWPSKNVFFFAVKHVLFSKVAILYVSGEGEVTITAFLRADMSPKAPK